MSEPPATQLIVVRHGETVWNADGRLQGHIGGELSALGQRQAQAVAARLAREPFDALYSSDLSRAVQTAEQIARQTGRKIKTDTRLRERCMGIFETLTWSEVRQRHADEYARYQSGDPEYVIAHGESSRQVNDRVIAAMDEIVARHAGASLVIVAHGGVLHRLFRLAVGLPLASPRRWTLYNGSINRFAVQAGHWTLRSWGEIEHLRDIGTEDDT